LWPDLKCHPVICLERCKKTTKKSQDRWCTGIRSGYIPNTGQMCYCLSHLVIQMIKQISCRVCKTMLVIVFTRYIVASQLSQLCILTHDVFYQVDIRLRLGLTSRLFLQVFRLKLVCGYGFCPFRKQPQPFIAFCLQFYLVARMCKNSSVQRGACNKGRSAACTPPSTFLVCGRETGSDISNSCHSTPTDLQSIGGWWIDSHQGQDIFFSP
jgi:hypothetical protein